MKALVRFVVVAGLLSAFAYAASVQGFLVDRACGAKMASTNDQNRPRAIRANAL
jgi:siroheme synthase